MSLLRRFVPVSLFLMTIALPACDATGPERYVGGDACGLTLRSRTASPGSSLVVTGIAPEETMDSLDARFRTSPDEVGAATLVYRLGGDTAAVLVPFHPSGVGATGKVELVFRTSQKTCYLGDIDIAALPAAPGAAQRVLTSVEGALTAAVGRLGLEVAVLKGDPATWPAEVQGYGVLQFLLDHPDNPNSFARMLDGTAPALAGQPIDRSLLESVLVSSGFIAALEQSAAALVTPTGPSSSLASAMIASAAAAPPMDAARLDELMRQQAHFDARSTLDAKRLNAAVGNMVALLGLVPQLKVTATLASWCFFFANLWTELGSATLPSELTSLSFDASPSVLMEEGSQVGHWSNAKLQARGGDYELELPTVLDAMINALGWPAEDALRAFLKVNPQFKAALFDVLKPVTDNLIGQLSMLVDTKSVSWNPELKFYRIGPFFYPPVSVDDARWVTPAAEPAGIIQIPAGDRTAYQAVAAGSAELVLRTVEGRFGGERAEARRTIRVGGGVQVSPAVSTVRQGQIVTYLAAVFGIADQRVTWSATGGTIDGSGVWTAPQATGSYTITATSVGNPAAKGTATVDVRSGVFVKITPAEARLDAGESKGFTATVEDATDTRVTWRATAGTITQDGFFTAPATPGERITITAVSVQDTTSKGHAEVLVEPPSPFVTATIYPPWSSREDAVIRVGVDARGVVVGTLGWSTSSSPFRWEAGAYTRLPGFEGYEFGYVNAISDGGHAVGRVNNPTAGTLGAMRWQNGTVTRITSSHYTDEAYGVNDNGDVVGDDYTPGASYHRPFLWSNGTLTRLPLPEAALGARAWDLNDARVAVGQFDVSGTSQSAGIIWQNGTYVLPTGLASAAGINNLGQVAGSILPERGKPRAVLWQNGTYHDLGALSGGVSVAADINDLGHVVGWSQTTADVAARLCRPVLWRDGFMLDLSQHLPDDVTVRRVPCVSPYLLPDPQVGSISISETGHIVVLVNLPPVQPGWAARGAAVILVPR